MNLENSNHDTKQIFNLIGFFFSELNKIKTVQKIDLTNTYYYQNLDFIVKNILNMKKIDSKSHFLILSLLFGFNQNLFSQNKTQILNSEYYEENKIYEFFVLYEIGTKDFYNFDKLNLLLANVRLVNLNIEKVNVNFYHLFNRFKSLRNTIKDVFISKQLYVFSDLKLIRVLKEINLAFIQFQNDKKFTENPKSTVTVKQNLIQFLIVHYLSKAFEKKKFFDNKTEAELFYSKLQSNTFNKNYNKKESDYDNNDQEKEKLILNYINKIFLSFQNDDNPYFFSFLDLNKEIQDLEILSHFNKKILKLGLYNEYIYKAKSYLKVCQIILLQISDNLKYQKYPKNDFSIISLFVKANNENRLHKKLKQIFVYKLLPYFIQEVFLINKIPIDFSSILLNDEAVLAVVHILAKNRKNRKLQFFQNLLYKIKLERKLIYANISFESYELWSLNWEINLLKIQAKSNYHEFLQEVENLETYILAQFNLNKCQNLLNEIYILIDLNFKMIGVLNKILEKKEFVSHLEKSFSKILRLLETYFEDFLFGDLRAFLENCFKSGHSKISPNSTHIEGSIKLKYDNRFSKNKFILKLLSQITYIIEIKNFYHLKQKQNVFLRIKFYLTQKNFSNLKSINLLFYLELMKLEIKTSKINLFEVNQKIMTQYFIQKDIKNDYIKLRINLLSMIIKLEDPKISEREFLSEFKKEIKLSLIMLKKKLKLTNINYIFLLCEIHQIILSFTKNQIIALKLLKEIIFIVSQLLKIEKNHQIGHSKYYFDIDGSLLHDQNLVLQEIYFFLFEKNIDIIKLNFFKSALCFLNKHTFEKSLYSSLIALLQNSLLKICENTKNFLLILKIKNKMFEVTNEIDKKFFQENLNIPELKNIMSESDNLKVILKKYQDFLELIQIENFFKKQFLKLAYYYVLTEIKKSNKNLSLIFLNKIYIHITLNKDFVLSYAKMKCIQNLFKSDYCVLFKKILLNNEDGKKGIFFFTINHSDYVRIILKTISANSRKIQHFILDYIFFKLVNNFITLFNNKKIVGNLNDMDFSIYLYNFNFLFYSFFHFSFKNNFLDLSRNFLNCYFSLFTLQKNYLYNKNHWFTDRLEYHICQFCKSNKKNIELNYFKNLINYMNSDFLFKSIYKKYFVMDENQKNIKKSLNRLTITNTKKNDEIVENSFLFKKLLNKKDYDIFIFDNEIYLNDKNLTIEVDTIAFFSFEWIFNYSKIFPVCFFNFSKNRIIIIDTIFTNIQSDLLDMNSEIEMNEKHLKNQNNSSYINDLIIQNDEDRKINMNEQSFNKLNNYQSNSKYRNINYSDHKEEDDLVKNNPINLKKNESIIEDIKNSKSLDNNFNDNDKINSLNIDTKIWWEERHKRDHKIREILIEVSKKLDYIAFLIKCPIFTDENLDKSFYQNFNLNYKILEDSCNSNFIGFCSILFFNTSNLLLMFLYSFSLEIFIAKKNENIDLVEYINIKIENFKNKIFFFTPVILGKNKNVLKKITQNIILFYKRIHNHLNCNLKFFVS